MPYICRQFKHKKDLITAITNGKRVAFEDPSVHAPRDFVSTSMQPGDTLTCTSPERKWFARVERKHDGWKIT